MAAIPLPEHQVVQAIYRTHEMREAAAEPRGHLGASVIGHPCERWLWLSFRWVARERFDGRMLRLFEAGKAFEARIVAELRAAGIEVTDCDEFGRQWRIALHGGHFSGSLDGAALKVPEAPKTWHVTEFKTSNDKGFGELQTKGVQLAKPMHAAQMQTYMGATGMTRALYIVENKNTSALYSERIEFDPVEFERLVARAARVIGATEPPARISTDPGWWQCRTCHFRSHCHAQAVPEVNCRTCAHATPELDGDARWSCALRRVDIDLPTQRAGCNGHRFIPLLLEKIGEQTDATDEPGGNATVHYRRADGSTFSNGAPPAFASSEIAAAAHPEMLGDATVQAFKAAFPDARLVA